MRISRIVGALENARVHGVLKKDIEIERLCADSRENCVGALFFCLSTDETAVITHAKQAIEKGAVGIVSERKTGVCAFEIVVPDARAALSQAACVFYGYPADRMKVIAITGTNGKTTTAYMLASILRAWGKRVGVVGTLGAEYAGKRVDTGFTTPDPIDLQRILCDMSSRGAEFVVMEVSAHALYYRKLAGVCFSACIFTNLSQDHLDFFPSLKAYGQVKKRLFADGICPIAILNGDDEFGRIIGNDRTGKTLYYGLQTPADAFAVITDERLDGSDCILNINDGLYRGRLRLTGRHNIYNALAAASCAVSLGADLYAVETGLAVLDGVNGRLERVANIDGVDIFVDFAHTADGLEKSLTALRAHCKNKLLCLFGCGGNRDKTKRAPMGETVAKHANFAVLTSDNPRYEDPLDIIAEIEKGYRRFSLEYVIVPKRERAIRYAVERAGKGDILLIAGKGAEEYQEIMGIKYPFSDKDIIAKIREEKDKERE